MDDYMMTGRIPELEQTAPPHAAGNAMRMAGQIAGLVLIVAGGSYALLVIVAILNITRDPSHLTTLLGTMAKAVGLEDTTVIVAKTRFRSGAPSAVCC